MSDIVHPPITKEELINLQKTFFITVFYLVKDKKMWARKRDLKEVQQILQDNINHSDKAIKVLSCCLHQSIQEGPLDSADEAIRLCVQWVKEAKGRKKFRAENGLDIVLLLSVLEIFSLKDINIIAKINGEEFVDLLIAFLKMENISLLKSKLLNIQTSAVIIIYTLVTQNHYQGCLDYRKTLEVIDVYTDCEDLTLKVISTLTMAFLCDSCKQEIREIKGEVLDTIVQWLSSALQMPNKKFGQGFHAKHLIQSLNKIVENQNNLKQLTEKIDELQENALNAFKYRRRNNSMSPTPNDQRRGTINRKKNKNFSKDIDILLVGKTGRKIKVVDGPGVEDTDNMRDLEKATEVMIEKMQDAVLNHPEGYHAFLLVVRYGGRFTCEDKKVVEILKSIFGQQIVESYCVILMTHGDVYRSHKQNRNKKFGKWCSEQKGVLKELLEECGNRAVLFDNNTEDPEVREKQMNKLIKVIDRLQYSGRRYCDKHFELAEERRQSLLVQCKEPRITENIRKECSLLLERAKNISQYEPEEQLSELKVLLAEAENLKVEVLKSDRGTGVLTAAINLSSHLFVTIDSQINILNTKREKSEIEKEKAEITKNYEEKIKQFEADYKREAFEVTTFRQSQMKKSIEEKFAQDIQQIQVLETKIQDLEEKLNEQTQMHQSNLDESQKKYEEMIEEMNKKLNELKEKYSTVGKRLKNLCKQQ
ncbi:hypothetical protein Btru_048136 [Bulinus truncatus]|nr:hypothetical protein Btru_048136 [Bulinus truncatus]